MIESFTPSHIIEISVTVLAVAAFFWKMQMSISMMGERGRQEHEGLLKAIEGLAEDIAASSKESREYAKEHRDQHQMISEALAIIKDRNAAK